MSSSRLPPDAERVVAGLLVTGLVTTSEQEVVVRTGLLVRSKSAVPRFCNYGLSLLKVYLPQELSCLRRLLSLRSKNPPACMIPVI